jgi:hypothetical protein
MGCDSTGTCGPAPQGLNDNLCAQQTTPVTCFKMGNDVCVCDGTGQCLYGVGATCTKNADCAFGLCMGSKCQ